jgi:hypothetical protein
MAVLQPRLRRADGRPFHRARLFTLAALVLALVRFRTTNLARLCLAFPGRAHETSAYRRLQRFFADVTLNAECLHDLLLCLAPGEQLTLALDRTEWKAAGHTHNLLVVGYLRHGVVVPLAWRALGKRGSSHQQERIALLTALFERLPPERVVALLGDREFIGEDFLGWLDGRGISFVIRARKNAWIECVRSGVAYQAAPLFALLGDGGRRRLRGKWQVYGTSCFVTATRRGGSTWVLISNRRPNAAEVLYQQRWQIADGTSAETLFGALKSRGFDLEATHLAAPERIERLFGVLAVALVWVLSVGRWRVVVRAERRASHGRLRRSLFRVGLDGATRMLLQGESRQLRRTFQVLSCT